MTSTLIIAEKPSVARDLANVLGASSKGDGCLYNDAYTITWCFGHLVELADAGEYKESWHKWELDALPLLPAPFMLRAKESGQDQYNKLCAWLNDPSFSCVINACDAGREGELIFGYVYELSGSTLPTKRLWIASLTRESIQKGFQNLGDGKDFHSLYESAKARSQADWLVGINGTRLITLMTRLDQPEARVPILSLGRVQTPTLALVVKRDRAHEDFTPETTWGIQAEFCTLKGHHYKGKAQDHEGTPLKWSTKDEALSFIQTFKTTCGERARVTSFESKQSERQSPQFFDLTSLQREANTRFGFSAQQTLDLAQSLYERHKLLTYPRTDSRHITRDIAATLIGRIKTLHEDHALGTLAKSLRVDVQTLSKRLVNADKVTDHHAILPTKEPVLTKALSQEERKLYELVSRRMLAALAHPALIQRTSLTTTWGTLAFVSQGTQVITPGWMAFEKEMKSSDDETEDASSLPSELALESVVSPIDVQHLSSTTRAPAYLTEASLLRAMETAGKSLEDEALASMVTSSGGLGTPATRAGTIEVLLAREYMERQGKSLVSTPLGRSLVDALTAFPSLTSAEMTGRWEQALEHIVDGKLSASMFQEKIELLVQSMVKHFKANPPQITLPRQDTLAPCPDCSRPLFLSDKVAWCQGRKTDACTFVVFRQIAGKKLTSTQMTTLITHKKTGVMKGFKSKTGSSFEAALALTKKEEGWKVSFVFEDRPKRKKGKASKSSKKTSRPSHKAKR